jgi:predicted ribonuclease toxin of YeeF-YezG toxin-antitoxin module
LGRGAGAWGTASATGGGVDYSRPGLRKYVKQDSWDLAFEASPDGIVRDAVTGEPIDPNKDWQMGHKPGYEFSKHQESAAARNISREQFIDEYNNASHFRPEFPESNASHAGEDHSNRYLGD